MNNNEKGKIYEEFINTHINTLTDTKISYLWSDVPEQVLFDANLITDYNKHRLARKNKNKDKINSLQDIGIDIIKINNDDEIIFVQCKNYKNTLMVNDLGGFWMIMLRHPQKYGYVYHSTNKISTIIKENLVDTKIKFIHKPMTDKIVAKDIAIKLYDYQQAVVLLYDEYYKTNLQAVLSMPCATGKTIISCYISKQYDVVIFISPLKQFAEQNIDRFKAYDTDREYLLVDSDGTRDIDEIKKFVKANKKIMLSVTYKSCDIIVKLFDVLINPFFIVDEFHNLSAKNIYGENDGDAKNVGSNNIVDSNEDDGWDDIVDNNEDDEWNNDDNNDDGDDNDDDDDGNDDDNDESKKNRSTDPLNIIINSENKILYMSATPRIYELEYNNDCDIEDILGKVVYKMDFKIAIENKYITDYDIYLPIMEDNSKVELDGLIVDIKKELKTKFKDVKLSQKCCYLYECIKQFGKLKCIIYFQSHKEIQEFIKCFNKINEYYSYDYKIDSLTCDDSRKKRIEKINVFKNCDTNGFLCAVHILDECIDIPECNSIYVTYNCKSKVKNVQRMSRAMRLDKSNSNKKAKIILWCDEIAEMTTYMSSIKEIDLNYNKKVNYVKFNKGLVKVDKIDVDKYVAKYSKYIVGVQKYRGFNWTNMLEKVEKFIVENGKKPAEKSKNKEENIMARWIDTQKQNYKKKAHLMLNQDIYTKWTIFTNKYKEYFRSNDEDWNIMLSNVEKFIIINKKRPTTNSNNIEYNIMCHWIGTQQKNYKDKKQIMKNKEIYNKWAIFKEKYIKYFQSNYENWNDMLNNIEKFIINNKKRPFANSKNKEEKKMGHWLSTQQKNHKNKENVMKNQEIYDSWTIFINKHIEYFRSNKEEWNVMFECVEKFIINNNRRPSLYLKNNDEKIMGKWIYNQQKNYKKKTEIMKTQEIYNKWTVFKEKYIEYFRSNYENWNTMLSNIETFIMDNKRKPSSHSKNNNEKIIGQWISNQLIKYKKKIEIMKNQEIYDKWTTFKTKYGFFFM